MLTEDQECYLLVEYLNLKNIKYTHINNEMWTKSWKQKARAKRMGVSPGFPDYLILIKNKLMAIEMKRSKGGVLSDNQREWLEALKACGIDGYVCKGFEEAKKIIDSYK